MARTVTLRTVKGNHPVPVVLLDNETNFGHAYATLKGAETMISREAAWFAKSGLTCRPNVRRAGVHYFVTLTHDEDKSCCG